jgi:hypothetical protein
MGKSPRSGIGGGQAAQPQATYGGQTMSQADADAKYRADMAAWRAPTTTGTAPTVLPGAPPADINGVPQMPTHYMGDPNAGPALPAFGVLPTAPVAIQRSNLASVMTPPSYFSPYSPNSNSGGGYQQGYQGANAYPRGYTGPGTAMSPFSPNSNSGGGYQYRPPQKFFYGGQSGSR